MVFVVDQKKSIAYIFIRLGTPAELTFKREINLPLNNILVLQPLFFSHRRTPLWGWRARQDVERGETDTHATPRSLKNIIKCKVSPDQRPFRFHRQKNTSHSLALTLLWLACCPMSLTLVVVLICWSSSSRHESPTTSRFISFAFKASTGAGGWLAKARISSSWMEIPVFLVTVSSCYLIPFSDNVRLRRITIG